MMLRNLTHIPVLSSFPSHVSDTECTVYRCISIIFVVGSFGAFLFDIRFLLTEKRRLNPFMYSLICNSLVSILLGLPYILIQSINCYPVHSHFICYLQGFACFTCGISVMYTMTLLALTQFTRLFYNSSCLHKFLEHKNGWTVVFAFWFIAFAWSTPPFLKISPGFFREGYGFDCGLGWIATDIGGRIYLFLAFILIYVVPLFCIIYTNFCILTTIRRLLCPRDVSIPKTTTGLTWEVRHRLVDLFTKEESNRLKRLRIDRRFACATMITVIFYLIAWTPYAICGLIQMISAMTQMFFQPHGLLLAGAALTAKLAVIVQPCVYYYTLRTRARRHSSTS